MKINHFMTIKMTAFFDPNSFIEKIKELFPENEIDFVMFKNIGNIVQIRNLYTGEIIVSDQDDERVPFSIDVLCFSSGVFIFHVTYQCEKMKDKLKSTSFINEKCKIIMDNEERNDPLLIFTQIFFSKIIDPSILSNQISNINIIDENAQKKMNEILKKTIMIESFFIGDNVHLDLSYQIDDIVLINEIKEGDNNYKDGELISAEPLKIYRKDKLYYCLDYPELFLEEYLINIYRRNLVDLYNEILIKWIVAIKEEGKFIRSNLKQTNKIYWEKLKNKLEEWDLHFLDLYSSIIQSLPDIEIFNFSFFNKDENNKISNEFNVIKEILFRNMEDVKYLMQNINTPGHAHDEQLLQRETEKGNERILLLSFFAMSIPLLGAIFAPGILISFKIISAIVIISLPLIYINIRKFHFRHNAKINMKGYLKNILNSQKKDYNNIENMIERMQVDKKNNISKKSKDETISILQKSLAVTGKYISQIEEEMKKY